MLEVLKKELNISIITSLIYIVLGIVIVSNPVETIDLVGKVVAILAVIFGIVVTVINVANIKEENSLLLGIFALVMGIALLVYPASLSILISLGLGIWFISGSVTRIKLATMLKDASGVNWSVILFGAILTLVIGISFVFAPLASAVALTTASGILMIGYSIIDIFEIILIKKNMSAIEKVL